MEITSFVQLTNSKQHAYRWGIFYLKSTITKNKLVMIGNSGVKDITTIVDIIFLKRICQLSFESFENTLMPPDNIKNTYRVKEMDVVIQNPCPKGIILETTNPLSSAIVLNPYLVALQRSYPSAHIGYIKPVVIIKEPFGFNSLLVSLKNVKGCTYPLCQDKI